MIDFSTLQGLTIPEGVVTQIADASGRMLWSAVKKAKVTIVGGNESYCFVRLQGFDSSETRLYNTTLEVPVGTVLYCTAVSDGGVLTATISVNNTEVEKNTDTVNYKYTVTENTTIYCNYHAVSGYAYGEIDIVEVPEGCISFSVNNDTYIADEGMTWIEYIISTSYATFVASNAADYVRDRTSGTLYVWYDANKTTKVPAGDVITPNGKYYLEADESDGPPPF